MAHEAMPPDSGPAQLFVPSEIRTIPEGATAGVPAGVTLAVTV